MTSRNKITGNALLFLVMCLAFTNCQKMDRPAMADYPKDTNPPGGPLKFFTAFENSDVDSIRANYSNGNTTTYAAGITGQGIQGAPGKFVKYTSANDFSKVTSFTISFWMKRNGPPAAGAGTEWVFGLPTTTDIWHKHEMFFFFEDANNPSSSTLAAAKFGLQDQWFEFIGAKRLPNLLNNQWHHVAFTYNEASSKLFTYIDGVVQYGNDPALTDVKKGAAPRGKLTFTNVSGFVIAGPGHHAIGATPDGWMGTFSGQLDQFRLYGVALSAAEIAALYASKL